MATVVNQPADSNNNIGFFLGLIALLIVLALVFFYGLPMLQGGNTGTTVQLPSNTNVDVGTK